MQRSFESVDSVTVSAVRGPFTKRMTALTTPLPRLATCWVSHLDVTWLPAKRISGLVIDQRLLKASKFIKAHTSRQRQKGHVEMKYGSSCM